MNDIYRVLEELEIEYEKFEHPPVYTVEEANRHRGRLPGGQTKNLFLRNKKGDRHYLVVAESDKQVNLKSLRELLNEAALSFASPKRLQKYLGVTPGSVSPFGLIHDVEKKVIVLLDEDLLRHDALGFHPNVNTATLVLRRAYFEKFLTHYGNEVRTVRLPS